ncbi:MAG: hypothetical protein GXO23_05630 [Crenarchaeota archaeon]|nr:hypothetical protein [Thermoproteota archaeon]
MAAIQVPSLVYPVKKLEGKYINVEVLSSRTDNRKFLVGTITCPFTGKKFELKITPQLDQVKPGIVQHDSGLLEHIRRTQQYREWIYERVEPYSRNSFHKRRYFVCRRCGFKTTRYIDALLHLAQVHRFLIEVP